MRTEPLPPLAVAISFIDRINWCDLEGLVRLMTEDHVLQILTEPPLRGREQNRDAWRGYMTSFPLYVIHPHRFAVDGARVAVLGHTTGSHLGLPDEQESRLTVIWLAETCEGAVATWRIAEDTAANRVTCGLSG